MARAPVALVQMPFGQPFWPSIGLSLLQAGLARLDLVARVRYLTFPFAERIGLPLYLRVAEGRSPKNTELAGEWVFAAALFGELAPPAADWLEGLEDGRLAARLRAARAAAAGFLDEWAERIAREEPRVVGFSSVFQQHCASLALARRLRERLPGALLVLGGANVEGVMGEETLARFPFLDAVVSGEGDRSFPDLVQRHLAGERPAGFVPGRPQAVLDELPVPDYRDFFADFARSRFARRWQPGIFFETSRGCWWGETQHCTFCGLNGASMAYRSKSAGRALAELDELTARHPGAPVAVVDNILDLGYFKDFLPRLAARGPGVELFYETKSNLRKDQLELMRAAGIRALQPGIESLSDEILRRMKKGVSGLQNLQLLKWCEELGLTPLWNFLWGFPGESPEEYARMARLVPLLVHLEPPVAAAPVRLDRFSPNFSSAAELGFSDVRPFPAYRRVYPFPEDSLGRLAYFFQHGYREAQDVAGYTAPLAAAIGRWKRVHPGSVLLSVDLASHLLVLDSRPGRRPGLQLLAGLERRVALALDAALGREALLARLGEAAPEGIDAALGRLEQAGLVVAAGQRWLSLIVPLGPHAPGPRALARLERILRRKGTFRLRRERPRARLGRLSPDRFELVAPGEVLLRNRG